MGLAEDNYAVLTRYLGVGQRPTRGDYQRSKTHRVPPIWNAGQSQNWWVLGTGVRYAFGDQSEENEIIGRLVAEREEIGAWGSEQHSPIYWAFHLVGRLALLKNTQGQALVALLHEQIADLFAYCSLALSPDGKEILWAGMRGCGHDEFASYELWWLWKVYFEGVETPRRKRYWRNKAEYGWLYDPWVAGRLSSLKVLSENRLLFGLVGKIRSTTHFMEFRPGGKLVYTEDDQHSATVFKGASGYLNDQRINGPANYNVRLRGAGPGSAMHVTYDGGHLRVEYSGVYNSLRGAKPVIFDGVIPRITKHVIWGPGGLRNA